MSKEAENNKLIAEFMGAMGTPKYNPTEWDVYITGCLDVDSDDENAQHFYTLDEMKYHTSWDWLMPVVEKIESLRDTNGNAYRFTIDMCNAQIEETNIEILGGAFKLDTTYKAVVEFIKQNSNTI